MPGNASKTIKKHIAHNELRKQLLMASIISSDSTADREKNRERQRMDWGERVDSLSESQFRQRYRMDQVGFDDVLEKIRPAFPPMCANVPSQVPPELKLSMALRWMAGGSYLDIADLHRASLCRHR
jgi:hypothetical protein